MHGLVFIPAAVALVVFIVWLSIALVVLIVRLLIDMARAIR